MAWAAMLAGAVLLGAPAASPADTLSIGGAGYSRAEVRSFDPATGEIVFKYSGSEWRKPLEGANWQIALDRYPTLGQANAALTAKDYARAASLYAAVRPTEADSWLGGLLLVKQVESLDLAGRYAAAVNAYLRFLAMNWARPAISPPAQVSAKGSADLAAAIKALEAAQAKAQSDRDKTAIRTMLFQAYRQAGDPRAADLAGSVAAQTPPDEPAAPTPSGPAAAEPTVQDQALLTPVQQSLQDRKYDEGLSAARGISSKVSKAALPELFWTVARLYQGKGDRQRAGLAYMRIAIHFPASVRAAGALWEAAAIHESLGRADVARRIYQKLAADYAATEPGKQSSARLGGGS